MKIYISGKITGLPLQEARQRFDDAQALLEEIGFEAVNPMEKGLPADATWEQHMVKDFELLLTCSAIYMLDGWMNSTGAQIEYDAARHLGFDFLFESNVRSDNTAVMRIQNAIHEVTGMQFNEYTTKSRRCGGVFARMLFTYHCRKLNMTLTQIAGCIHRDHTSVLYFLRRYEDDFRYNPRFRDMATRVNDILNKPSE